MSNRKSLALPGSITAYQLEVLDGHMLGDGNLSKHKSPSANPVFKIGRGLEFKPYNLWTADIFRDYLTPSSIVDKTVRPKLLGNKEYPVSWFSTGAHPDLLAPYNRWYPAPARKKRVPRDLVLTPLVMAIWLADDGSVFTHKMRSTRKSEDYVHAWLTLATHGFEEEDCRFLQRLLQERYGFVGRREDLGINMWPDGIAYSGRQKYRLSCSVQVTFKILKEVDAIFPTLPKKRAQWADIDLTLPIPQSNPPCPFCAGFNSEKRGYDTYKDGRVLPKYKCVTCERGWTEGASDLFRDPRQVCPNCCSSSTQKGRKNSDKTSQIWSCNGCKNSWWVNLDGTPYVTPVKDPAAICVYCGSCNTRKAGLQKLRTENRQRYECNFCKARWYDGDDLEQPKWNRKNYGPRLVNQTP